MERYKVGTATAVVLVSSLPKEIKLFFSIVDKIAVAKSDLPSFTSVSAILKFPLKQSTLLSTLLCIEWNKLVFCCYLTSRHGFLLFNFQSVCHRCFKFSESFQESQKFIQTFKIAQNFLGSLCIPFGCLFYSRRHIWTFLRRYKVDCTARHL